MVSRAADAGGGGGGEGGGEDGMEGASEAEGLAGGEAGSGGGARVDVLNDGELDAESPRGVRMLARSGTHIWRASELQSGMMSGTSRMAAAGERRAATKLKCLRRVPALESLLRSDDIAAAAWERH